jgi:nitroreductase
MDQKLDFIFGRRSIRRFKPGEVSDATVRTLLDAAMAAPSARACDPWRFVVIRKRETMKRVTEILPFGKMMGDAAVGIIVCGDLEAAHDKQLSYLLQDCSAAIENLLLAVHTLGLGACWIGIHPREDRIQGISQLFGLPRTIIPVSGIAIGYPGESKESRTRYNPAYVHNEQW